MSKKWARNTQKGEQGFQRTTPTAASPSMPAAHDVPKTSQLFPSPALSHAVPPQLEGKDLRKEYLAYRRSLQEEENLKKQLKDMQTSRTPVLVTAIRMVQVLVSSKNPISSYEVYKNHQREGQRISRLREEMKRRKTLRESACENCKGSGVSQDQPRSVQCITCGRVNSLYAARVRKTL